jgi:hypothetical protein
MLHRRSADGDVMNRDFSRVEPSFVPAMPSHTIEELSAWQGIDLREPGDFTHQLTDAEIAEIDAAVQAIAQRGIDHIAIDRHNFELPQLGKQLTMMRDDVLLGAKDSWSFAACRSNAIRSKELRLPFSASVPISASQYRKTAKVIFSAM